MAGKDITGRRYGKLVAMYQNGAEKTGHAIWHCRCDCGNEEDVSTRLLRKRKNNGCLKCRRKLSPKPKHQKNSKWYSEFTLCAKCETPLCEWMLASPLTDEKLAFFAEQGLEVKRADAPYRMEQSGTLPIYAVKKCPWYT